jgi:hypothetical protein
MKKLTVKAAVLKEVYQNSGSTVKQIIAATKKPASQVYSTLSKLVKANQITRYEDKFFLSSNHKDEPPQANEDYETALEKKLQDLSVKYYDALAVIAYLEKKLNLA